MKYIKLFENFKERKYDFGDYYSENGIDGIVLSIDVMGTPLTICARYDLPSEILGLRLDQIKHTLSGNYSERDKIGTSNWRLPSTSEIEFIKSNEKIKKWDFETDVPYFCSDEGGREYEQRTDDKLDHQLKGNNIYLYSLSYRNTKSSLADKLGKIDGRQGRVRMVYDLFKKHYDDIKRDFVTEPRK
jgi:hypothetical protein